MIDGRSLTNAQPRFVDEARDGDLGLLAAACLEIACEQREYMTFHSTEGYLARLSEGVSFLACAHGCDQRWTRNRRA